MLDEDNPAVRAVRAEFQRISAGLGDHFERSRAEYEQTLTRHEQDRERWAKTPPEPPKRARQKQSDDPSDTGFFSVSWMTNR
ncbi:hypothetical protein V5P93_006769 [Actinokineospora auranticolor]|uniref:Uncharacterized protein n=1 Tax=Actinokineospora auranticolor TaxID=155976 RepID=A0A2S6GWM1_9PSEU|nr:hypothetical protein [Actinokineospora auranticolor]PPK69586.1 hypothetical protein CLV40_103196 [Actinokineospora auranticolor]